MPFFGLSDINFTENKGQSSLGVLENSQFQNTTYRYPIDLGSADKGHYIVFYIREQIKTNFQSQQAGGEKPFAFGQNGTSYVGNPMSITSGSLSTAANAIKSNLQNFGNQIASSISNGNFNLNSLQQGAQNISADAKSVLSGQIDSTQSTDQIINNSINQINGSSIYAGMMTRLTKDAIALYMPDTLLYNFSQGYTNADVGGELAGKAAAIIKSATDTFRASRDAGSGVLASVGKAAVGAAESGIAMGAQKVIESGGKMLDSGNSAKLIGAAALGAVTNPMLEMIYTGPSFRTFQFQFDFYPRSEREALQVQKIIERFYFHQAPEKLTGPGAGSEIEVGGFLVPPSEFDIKFYYGGRENPNIPQITPNCILKSINTNYAPDGFRTYEVQGETSPTYGRTGMPVHINLQLEFQETRYLTKSDFNRNLAQDTQTAPTAPTVETPRPALNPAFVNNAGGTATGIQKAYKGNNGGSGGGGASSPF